MDRKLRWSCSVTTVESTKYHMQHGSSIANMSQILSEIGKSLMSEISHLISGNDQKIISQNDLKIPSFSEMIPIVFVFIDFYDHFQQKFFFAIILRNDRNFRSNSPKFHSKFTQISINIGKKRRI